MIQSYRWTHLYSWPRLPPHFWCKKNSFVPNLIRKVSGFFSNILGISTYLIPLNDHGVLVVIQSCFILISYCSNVLLYLTSDYHYLTGQDGWKKISNRLTCHLLPFFETPLYREPRVLRVWRKSDLSLFSKMRASGSFTSTRLSSNFCLKFSIFSF